MLTNIEIKVAKPKEVDYKLTDSGGLFLLVTKAGAKYWRLKYRFNGKEKKLALGIYPAVSLLDAREGRELARKQLAEGADPSAVKKSEKLNRSEVSEKSFNYVALEWAANYAKTWTTRYQKRVIRILEIDVFPHIGNRQMDKITAPDLLAVIRKIEKRGTIRPI